MDSKLAISWMVANDTPCHPKNGLATHFVAKGIGGVCKHPQKNGLQMGGYHYLLSHMIHSSSFQPSHRNAILNYIKN
jgi:hypothetical protein